jgi:hypothetical protein
LFGKAATVARMPWLTSIRLSYVSKLTARWAVLLIPIDGRDLNDGRLRVAKCEPAGVRLLA